MNFAMACGHVEANPTRHIRLNRRPRLTRFLSREEIGRLHEALDENDRKTGGPQADIIRLLASDRMPQERDRATALVGNRR